MSTVDERLRTLLGADPPATVLALDEGARDHLADIVAEARARQTEQLKAAFEASLKHVPFPVRAVVKRVLGA